MLGVASGVRSSLSGSGLRQSVPAALPNSRRFWRSRNIAAGIRIVAGAVTVEVGAMHGTDEEGSARSVGEILKALREAERLLPRQVARGLNVSDRTLRAIERGIALPSREMDYRVALMFKRHEKLVAEYEKAVAEERRENYAAVGL